MISHFFSTFEVIFRLFTVEIVPYYFIVMFFACEQSNEPPVSIEFREFLDQPRICTAYETAIYRNPHRSSHWDSRITGQLDYKHTFYENVVPTKIAFPYFFLKKVINIHTCRASKDVLCFFSLLCISGLLQIAVSWEMLASQEGLCFMEQKVFWHKNQKWKNECCCLKVQ